MKHLFALLLLASFIFTCEGTPKHPVVLVPGLGASQLWIQKDLENVYKGEWIFFLKIFTTLLEDMTLDVNPQTGDVTDQANSKIKACGFGNPNVLTNLIISWFSEKKISVADCDGDQGEYTTDDSDFEEFMNLIEDGELNLSDICATCERCQDPGSLECKEEFKNMMGSLKDIVYFKYIVNELEAKGYKANKDIKGAPYDFRKAPDNLQEFYGKLKKLVEDLYRDNNNVPVVMIAHSLGNPVLLNFYNKHTTKEWKDTYIHAHVALAPPWAGAVKPFKFIVSGDNLDIPFVNYKMFRPMERSWPGIAWMMPSPGHGFWTPEEPLVATPTKEYSVQKYEELYRDLKSHDPNYSYGFKMFTKTQESVLDLKKLPELRALHVLYGDNVDTPIQYYYPGKSFPDGQPTIKTSKDGDGVVNKRSMEAFKELNSTIVKHHVYPGVDHTQIMRDERVLNFIIDLVLNNEDTNADNFPEEREKTEL